MTAGSIKSEFQTSSSGIWGITLFSMVIMSLFALITTPVKGKADTSDNPSKRPRGSAMIQAPTMKQSKKIQPDSSSVSVFPFRFVVYGDTGVNFKRIEFTIDSSQPISSWLSDVKLFYDKDNNKRHSGQEPLLI